VDLAYWCGEHEFRWLPEASLPIKQDMLPEASLPEHTEASSYPDALQPTGHPANDQEDDSLPY